MGKLDDEGDQAEVAGQLDEIGALPLRAAYGPFDGWDAIEQGEMHYFTALVYYHLNAVKKETAQLGLAETAYKCILDRTPSSRWFIGGTTKRLRVAAQAGLDRVNRAQGNADYDTVWLLPPSNGPQNPTGAIGSPSGE